MEGRIRIPAIQREKPLVPLTNSQESVSSFADLEVVGRVEALPVTRLDSSGCIRRIQVCDEDMADEISHLSNTEVEITLWPKANLRFFLESAETIA